MTTKAIIEKHLLDGNISAAISTLIGFLENEPGQEEDYNDVLLIGERWSSLEKEYKVSQTISWEAYELSKNKIILGITYIIKGIKDENQRFNAKIQQFDIFISTTTPESRFVKELHGTLSKKRSTYLRSVTDSEHTKWVPSKTIQALSKLSLILVDNLNGNPEYDYEEAQNALELERNLDNRHSLMVAYTNDIPLNSSIPYAIGGRSYINVLKEKNIESIADKIINLLNDLGDGNDSIEELQKQKHPLKRYARGPMVDAHLVNTAIIQNYAKFIKPREALQIIAEANAMRLEADPNTPSATTIKEYQLLPVQSVTPYEFWLDAFKEARLHGPRMLAALLLVVPDDQFDIKAREAKFALLKILSDNNSQ